MGLLDNVFGGSGGVSALLHGMLGTTATIRVKSFERDSATGALVPSFVEYEVPFVPSNAENSRSQLNSAGVSRSDVRESENTLSGTFPCAYLGADLAAERDSIVFGGVEYAIESFEKLQVGDADVQFSIRARRS